MNYEEAVSFLYNQLPYFQNQGKSAFKPGLANIEALLTKLSNPHKSLKFIHVAGTNGKGSTCHLLASVLIKSGYKVAYYTSPHLVDFRERIKINGESITQNEVCAFVEKAIPWLESIKASFFELTLAMALDYFSREKVDIVVLEVGMGGRLDATNIVDPDISIITNIGFDHMEYLGDTLDKIAVEKAGIIKKKKPVVIFEQIPETKPVFIDKSNSESAPIYFVQDYLEIIPETDINISGGVSPIRNYYIKRSSSDLQLEPIHFSSDLVGDYQYNNITGVLFVLSYFKDQFEKVTINSILSGFKNVIATTGLQGRWQQFSENPLCITDVGHNKDGLSYLKSFLIKAKNKFRKRFLILGFVNDKDVESVFKLLEGCYDYLILTEPSVFRKYKLKDLIPIAEKYQVVSYASENVQEALNWAKSQSEISDFIYVGGSTFVVADLLKEIQINT